MLLADSFRFDFLEMHQFCGNGIDRFYKHLDRYYPDAKFILLERDEQSWLRSYERHLEGTQHLNLPNYVYIYNLSTYGAGNFEPDLWLESYRRHNCEVKEYFRNRPNKLLVMNICDGDGYEQLCPFLDVPLVSEAFPRENVTKDRVCVRSVAPASADSVEGAEPWHKYSTLKKSGWYMNVVSEWRHLVGTDAPQRSLEIGSGDGISANLILDVLFTHPDSEVHCVEPFLDRFAAAEKRRLFAENARIGKHERRIFLYEGLSTEILAWMAATEGFWLSFDFIYINGSQRAGDVLIDAALSWNLLKTGGTLAFNENFQEERGDKYGRTSTAIDAFAKIFLNRATLMFEGPYRLLRKIAN